MSEDTNLPFNISVFISTLFLLEFATDKFISHTAKLASLVGVSELLIGLITAGTEWEEVSSSLYTSHAIFSFYTPMVYS